MLSVHYPSWIQGITIIKPEGSIPIDFQPEGYKSKEVKDKEYLNDNCLSVIKIEANGEELVKCCEILRRAPSKSKTYTFIGVNAQEIAANW
jgi:hypothetical protein